MYLNDCHKCFKTQSNFLSASAWSNTIIRLPRDTFPLLRR